MSLVLLKSQVADGWPLCIKHDSQSIGLKGIENFAHCRYETEYGVGGKTFGVGQLFDGVIGAIEERIPVDQNKSFISHAYSGALEVVELSLRDGFENGGVQFLDEPVNILPQCWAVQEVRIKGLARGQGSSRLVDEGLNTVRRAAQVLGLNDIGKL